MAFPNHWLMSYGGTMCGGAEIWNNGIRFAPAGDTGNGVVDETAMVDSLGDKVAAFVATSGSGYGNDAKLEWLKFNEIGPTGAYADTGYTHVKEFTPVVSPASVSAYPPQIALCVSFGTEFARGYASKGRLFIPRPKSMVADSTGQMDPNQVQIVADAWAVHLLDLANMPGFDLNTLAPSVVSNVPADGAANPITKVRVGSVLDTQRRRRNALIETYKEAVV